jgi:hypothetical protein
MMRKAYLKKYLYKVLGGITLLPFAFFLIMVIAAGNDDLILKNLGLVLQLSYAAMIASFWGGIHWRGAMRDNNFVRLTLSMVPMAASLFLLGRGLMSGTIGPLWGMVIVLWFVYAMDRIFLTGPLWPRGYLIYRFTLTVLVMLLLIGTIWAA